MSEDVCMPEVQTCQAFSVCFFGSNYREFLLSPSTTVAIIVNSSFGVRSRKSSLAETAQYIVQPPEQPSDTIILRPTLLREWCTSDAKLSDRQKGQIKARIHRD